MLSPRKELFAALALITGGVLVFFVFLALTGTDPDERPLGLLQWVIGGMLIAPGFGKLIHWRRTQSRPPTAETSKDPS